MKLKKMAVPALILLLAFALLSGCTAKQKDNTRNKSELSGTSSVTASSAASSVTVAQIDPQLSELHKKIDESGYQAGIAYIGFVGSETTEREMRIYLKSSPYAEKYAFLCDAPLVDAGGTELYAIVTTRADRSASVYPADITDGGKYNVHTEKVLYKGKGTDCFLLRCNISELHSNVSILFTTGDEHFSVNPILSGTTRSIDISDCYDFSIYSGGNGMQDDVMIAYGLLLEADEVRHYTDLGMSLQYTGQTQIIDGRSCWIFALGTEHDGQFIRELYYGVCDNLIYSYDAVNDTWSVLGAG